MTLGETRSAMNSPSYGTAADDRLVAWLWDGHIYYDSSPLSGTVGETTRKIVNMDGAQEELPGPLRDPQLNPFSW